MPQLRSGFVALSIRNYRLYWIGQIVSLVGTWMQSVSQPWLVLLLGGSPIQLGIVLALQFAPSMVLAPLGGVIADRGAPAADATGRIGPGGGAPLRRPPADRPVAARPAGRGQPLRLQFPDP